jgi:hypothetical protein
MAFAIKIEVRDLRARTFVFARQKTMYGGKHIAKGGTVFVFASENEGGQGLIARGVVTFGRSDREETRCRPANASREHRRQTNCAREAATGAQRTKTIYRLE